MWRTIQRATILYSTTFPVIACGGSDGTDRITTVLLVASLIAVCIGALALPLAAVISDWPNNARGQAKLCAHGLLSFFLAIAVVSIFNSAVGVMLAILYASIALALPSINYLLISCNEQSTCNSR